MCGMPAMINVSDEFRLPGDQKPSETMILSWAAR
jgi:hypothetical protein